MPSLWTAYRTPRPTGISSGTWLLVLGELTCWLTFGLHTADPRLITLGTSGIIVSVLMLARIYRAAREPQVEVLADERSRDVKAKLSRDHELIYPPIQEFWDAAVSGTS
jgi:hypothetical protein